MKGLFTTLTCFCLILTFCSDIRSQAIHPADGELFRDDVIPRIDIFLPEDTLDWILDPTNLSSNHHFRAMFIFDNGTVRDTVENVGFRLRGNTSRTSAKKSFKVSFNTFESGRQYQGVEKLNLNGEHNDPSVSRAKVCWDLARDIGVPAARSNHVEFYINNAFRGVYINVEHIDEEFVKKRFGNNSGNLYKCLWPADLNYLGSNPDLYKDTHAGRPIYALKTNTAEDDYSDLAHFIDILNNTPLNDLPCELEQVFHVDNYLRSIALDILTGNWDGPIFNKNNFYLYHNLESGQFEYIPYDLDNTMGIDWFNIDWSIRDIYAWSPGNEARPIYDRLMQVQEYKDRFSFYLNEIISSHYQSSSLFPRLDHFKNSLNSLIVLDTFYPLDYGFSTTDFQQSFEMTLPYNHTDAGLKPFITARKNAVLNQLSLNDISPIINNIQHNRPDNQEDIEIQVSVRDDNSLSTVEFCYSTTDPNVGSCITMKDDGMNLDGQAGDGVYGLIIPALNQSAILHYYIKATDDQSQESLLPRCETGRLFVGRSDISLAINEFMAKNEASLTDSAGEFDDWIELYNYGTSPIYLGDKYLSDKPDRPNKWQMPDLWIQPDEYMLIWADEDGFQGPTHANFKLSAGGESLGIYDTDSTEYAIIDEISFDVQQADLSYGRIPNGTGTWQSMSPSPGASNEPLGIDRLALLELELTLSPVPFREVLHIHLDNPNRNSLSLRFFDLQGRVIHSTMAQENLTHTLQTKDLAPGIYFLQVYDQHHLIHSRKLMKW